MADNGARIRCKFPHDGMTIHSINHFGWYTICKREIKKWQYSNILWEVVIRHGFTFRILMNKHSARAKAHHNGILQCIGSIGGWEGMVAVVAGVGEEG